MGEDFSRSRDGEGQEHLEPAAMEASEIVGKMRDQGCFLVRTDPFTMSSK